MGWKQHGEKSTGVWGRERDQTKFCVNSVNTHWSFSVTYCHWILGLVLECSRVWESLCVLYASLYCSIEHCPSRFCNSRSLWRLCVACVFVQYLPVSVCVMFHISWSFVSFTPSWTNSICLLSENIFLHHQQGLHCLFMLWKYFDWVLFHPFFSSLALYSCPLLPPHHIFFLPFRLKKNIRLFHYCSGRTDAGFSQGQNVVFTSVEGCPIYQSNLSHKSVHVGTEWQSRSHIIKITLPAHFAGMLDLSMD